MANIELRIPINCKYYQLIYTKLGYKIMFSNEVVSFYQNIEEIDLQNILIFLTNKMKLVRYEPIFNNLPNLDKFHTIN